MDFILIVSIIFKFKYLFKEDGKKSKLFEVWEYRSKVINGEIWNLWDIEILVWKYESD